MLSRSEYVESLYQTLKAQKYVKVRSFTLSATILFSEDENWIISTKNDYRLHKNNLDGFGEVLDDVQEIGKYAILRTSKGERRAFIERDMFWNLVSKNGWWDIFTLLSKPASADGLTICKIDGFTFDDDGHDIMLAEEIHHLECSDIKSIIIDIIEHAPKYFAKEFLNEASVLYWQDRVSYNCYHVLGGQDKILEDLISGNITESQIIKALYVKTPIEKAAEIIESSDEGSILNKKYANMLDFEVTKSIESTISMNYVTMLDKGIIKPLSYAASAEEIIEALTSILTYYDDLHKQQKAAKAAAKKAKKLAAKEVKKN